MVLPEIPRWAIGQLGDHVELPAHRGVSVDSIQGDDRRVQASLLYFADCPSWQEAGRRLRVALDRVGHAGVPVDFVSVESGTAPGFRGSPTILVDGTDLLPGGAVSEELTCRIYRGENGLSGVPDLADLVDALGERSGS